MPMQTAECDSTLREPGEIPCQLSLWDQKVPEVHLGHLGLHSQTYFRVSTVTRD